MNQEERLKNEQKKISGAMNNTLSGLEPDHELAKKVIRFHHNAGQCGNKRAGEKDRKESGSVR